jgi:hypothetical protein
MPDIPFCALTSSARHGDPALRPVLLATCYDGTPVFSGASAGKRQALIFKRRGAFLNVEFYYCELKGESS